MDIVVGNPPRKLLLWAKCFLAGHGGAHCHPSTLGSGGSQGATPPGQLGDVTRPQFKYKGAGNVWSSLHEEAALGSIPNTECRIFSLVLSFRMNLKLDSNPHSALLLFLLALTYPDRMINWT